MPTPVTGGRRHSRQQADQAIATLMRRLARARLLPPHARFDTDGFHRLRQRVRGAFQVPQTSVTPVMARLLFALGDVLLPRRLLVIGSYCGNTLVWLAGRRILQLPRTDQAAGEEVDGAPDAAYLVGCDVDADACETARANFTRIGAGDAVQILPRDGHRVLSESTEAWDLVLLDADDPVRRKAVYDTLLEVALPWLNPGSTVLAHDTALPLFADDLRSYRERIADRSRFAATADLAVDECGLSFSVVAGPPSVGLPEGGTGDRQDRLPA